MVRLRSQVPKFPPRRGPCEKGTTVKGAGRYGESIYPVTQMRSDPIVTRLTPGIEIWCSPAKTAVDPKCVPWDNVVSGRGKIGNWVEQPRVPRGEVWGFGSSPRRRTKGRPKPLILQGNSPACCGERSSQGPAGHSVHIRQILLWNQGDILPSAS